MIGSFSKQFSGLSKKAEDELQSIGKVTLTKLKPPSGPYAIFHHQSHAIARVRDVVRILRRMHKNSMMLIKLTLASDKIMPKDYPAGVTFPRNVCRIHQKEHDLTEYMKLDFESLYVFGTILLDQWAFIVAYLMGYPAPEEYSFLDLINQIEKEGDKGRLSKLWDKKRSQMIWLCYQVRFYRNRFIVHANRPWQRGTTRSSYGDSFNLFTPSPPGWLDDNKVDKEIFSLIHLAPQHIQDAPDDYWQKRNPRALLECLFNNIGQIKNKKDREKTWELVKQVGGSTPDYKTIGLELLNFVGETTPLVMEEAINHIEKVNLGEP